MLASRKENIFVELGRHMPEENFFTEAFSFLLGQDTKLARFLINEILMRGDKRP